ncbi:MAG: type II secretion system protein GspM [Deltaproteobacteria bacterium]|nr:type II secretion system protein GspM [Deltaproteobacteria bacterium]
MKKWPLRGKGKTPGKKFLWLFIGVASAILIYTWGFAPLMAAKKKADEEIALKRRLLGQYGEILQNRKAAEDGLGKARKQAEEIQKRLLPGETPQLGAANLQDVVKRLAERNFLSLRSFRILEAKEMGAYRKISLQIDFNPINSMLNLSQFIYELEHQEKVFMISEMDVIIFNPRMPNTVQGNLVISGLMKGNQTKEKGKGK